MDNFSQEDVEEGTNNQEESTKASGDIQFEEIVDIDKLQNELNKQLEQDKIKEETPEAEKPTEPVEEVKQEVPKTSIMETAQTQIIPNAKKYVIYIDSFNIDYLESLSINDRRVLINKILREQKELTIEKQKFQEKKHFLTNLIIAIFTFLISFPLLFLCVNKGMELTMVNYKQAVTNFSKLYKEHGKIQQKSDTDARNTKY